MCYGLMMGLCCLASGIFATTLPESVNVYPIPQEVIISGQMSVETVSAKSWNISCTDADAKRVLEEAFTKIKTLKLSPFADTWSVTVEFPSKACKQINGAYRLSITAGKISIQAFDAAGAFYAAQTVAQMVRNGKYVACEIHDYPDVPFRGTVEGFYGQPWSFEARKSQFRFYGKYKLNTYIYGPKDDPYHGFSNKWRDAYPADQVAKLKELVTVAHENKVNFVWAVHPGRDISWKTDKDIEACIQKFEMMYALGIRSFAVFFDDIGGEGARAEMQVKLLNTVNRKFVKVKPDVTPLILCPTQYNRAWSGGEYLTILGTQLDADISIMWTGNSVCTDITHESQKWINNRIQRKAFIWWNWPVSDYVRHRLLLGKAYGNAKENRDLYSGFVSNPMDKPEASMIGLFGVADYTWNVDAYDADTAWREGIARLFPECSEAMLCFAGHNTDQGQNGHGYRRAESENVKPVADRVMAALKAGQQPSSEDLRTLEKEYERMEWAAETILRRCKDELFLDETHNWLKLFKELGDAGSDVCEALRTGNDMDDAIECVLEARAKMQQISDIQKARPFQTRIEVAGAVMSPLFNTMTDTLYTQLCQQLTGKKPVKVAAAIYKTIGNVPSLQKATASRDGKYVNFSRVLEVTKVQPGEWFGLVLPNGISANYIHAKLDTPNCHKQGRIEVSTDGGATWAPINTRNSGQEMQTGLDVNRGINAMRYINTSKEPVELKINLFKFDIPDGAQANVVGAMTDGNLNSGYTLQPRQSITLTADHALSKKQLCVLANEDVDTRINGSTLTITAEEHPATISEIIW